MQETRVFASQIDPVHLTQIVAKSLDIDSIKIKEWHCQTLTGGLEMHSAVVRCKGLAENRERILPWSLVIKKFSPDEQFDDPVGWRYWKREVLAFQSGFLENMPENLAAPHCFGVEDHPDGSIWVWMEDVADGSDPPWTMEVYAEIAHQLGLYNGAFLAGTSMPNDEWVTHDWLRKYVEHASPMVDFVRSKPDHPLVKSLYGGNRPFILAFWEVRNDLLKVLDGMPRVFCHQDAFKRNLFFHEEKLVGIDWGYAGIAPPGSEIVPLVVVAHDFCDFPIEKTHELDALCFHAYIRGLEEKAGHISSREVRRCYTFTMLLRYLLGGNVGEVLPALLDDSRHQWIEEGFNQSAEAISKTDPEVGKYYFSIFLESLRLMGIKPVLKIIWYTLKYSFPKKSKALETI